MLKVHVKLFVLYSLMLFFCGSSLQAETLADTNTEIKSILSESPPQKTILLLSSRGGYGHMAAATTLQAIIGNDYQIKVVYPIDQLRIWGVASGEQFYNMVLRNGWIRSMNFIVRHIVPRLFRSRTHKLEKIIHSHIQAANPDLVISLIPFVNYPASEAARKKEIPYLLITTDNDLRNWAYGLEDLKHPNFKVTIGADLPTTREVLLSKKVPSTSIETIGLPLRLDFIEAKNIDQIKTEYTVPLDKPVLLLMMGGAGGNVTLDYARRIGGMDLDTHLLICAGKNKKLKKQLSKIKLHPNNSMTILGFTEKIADLMAISDLIITKPGPGTINEALNMQLPLLVDSTNISLFWERANVKMVMQYGVAQQIHDYKEIKSVLRNYFEDKGVREQFEKSFAAVPQNHFHEKIKEIIHAMLERKPPILDPSLTPPIADAETTPLPLIANPPF